MSKRGSRTRKQQKLAQYPKDNYYLYCFEWKAWGHLGCAPANDLKTAFIRVCKDQKRLKSLWQVDLLLRLRKKKLLSKYVTVSRSKLEKPVAWIPAQPPW